jgi:sulfur-oxidizing protein SoxX|nr:sulfur oxidation c-type cytochrome SoxX [Rhodoplanes serenus]
MRREAALSAAVIAVMFTAPGRLPAVAQGAAAPSAGVAPIAPALLAVKVVEENGVPGVPQALTEKPGDPQAGAKVAVDRRLGNCLGCHQISALGNEQFHGEVGPSLDGAATRWTVPQLRMIVVDPKKIFSDETVMPSFYRVGGPGRVRPEFQGKPILTAQQVEDLVAFLAAQK